MIASAIPKGRNNQVGELLGSIVNHIINVMNHPSPKRITLGEVVQGRVKKAKKKIIDASDLLMTLLHNIC